MVVSIVDFQGLGANSKSLIGPAEDELIGLHIADRKRMRGGPYNYEVMDIGGGLFLGP